MELVIPPRMLIGGNWVAGQSGRLFATVNPATGETLGELPQADGDDTAAAVAAAATALPGWAALDAAERGRLLVHLADVLEAHRDRFAELETADNGRPIRETRAQAAVVPSCPTPISPTSGRLHR